MSNHTNLLENMSRDYLEIELDAIKNENILQSKQLDEFKRQIYRLKHRLAISKSIEGYFSSEIESLQRIYDAKVEELLKKIHIHEEQIILMHRKHTETIKYYEKELLKKDTDVENLIEIKNSSENVINDQTEKCCDFINDLKTKVCDLIKELHEYEFTYKDAILNNTLLKNKNNELAKELSKLKTQLIVQNHQNSEKNI